MYRHNQHLVNVFIWPGSDDRGRREISSEGYQLARWSDGSLQYWAVSDLNVGELEDLVELIRQAR